MVINMVDINKYRFGLEFECLTKEDFPKGGYSSSGYRISDRWITKSDSSVEPYDYIDAEGGFAHGIEFISYRMAYSELDSYIDELKRTIGDTTDIMTNVRINKTCGAHIHFSYGNKIFYNNVPLYVYKRVRKALFTRLPKYNNELAFSILGHYERRHSKLLKTIPELTKYPKERHQNLDGTTYYTQPEGRPRNLEFNPTSDTAMEWRAFNLLGVSKWSDVKALYKIAFSCLIDTFSKELDSSNGFRLKRPIPISSKVVPLLTARIEPNVALNVRPSRFGEYINAMKDTHLETSSHMDRYHKDKCNDIDLNYKLCEGDCDCDSCYTAKRMFKISGGV